MIPLPHVFGLFVILFLPIAIYRLSHSLKKGILKKKNEFLFFVNQGRIALLVFLPFFLPFSLFVLESRQKWSTFSFHLSRPERKTWPLFSCTA
jgi:hypothetical protein